MKSKELNEILELNDFSLIGLRLNAVADSAKMGGPCGRSNAANGRAPHKSHSFPVPNTTPWAVEAARLMGGHRTHPHTSPVPNTTPWAVEAARLMGGHRTHPTRPPWAGWAGDGWRCDTSRKLSNLPMKA
ncbi:hypothetical protein niasHT_023932 [Heterodera trifolii]|uniref:Uncharacterized protein n=1 Tax=Heterodera trifolii TaxID=157864 RepID=A0ABD2JVN1_9BILA